MCKLQPLKYKKMDGTWTVLNILACTKVAKEIAKKKNKLKLIKMADD